MDLPTSNAAGGENAVVKLIDHLNQNGQKVYIDGAV